MRDRKLEAYNINVQHNTMSLEIKVPPVGESITEVTLSRWVKKDGDVVAMDEVIAELESDKATFELTAEKAGTLKTIAKEGDTLAIGATVASIDESGAAAVQSSACCLGCASASACCNGCSSAGSCTTSKSSSCW